MVIALVKDRRSKLPADVGSPPTGGGGARAGAGASALGPAPPVGTGTCCVLVNSFVRCVYIMSSDVCVSCHQVCVAGHHVRASPSVQPRPESRRDEAVFILIYHATTRNYGDEAQHIQQAVDRQLGGSCTVVIGSMQPNALLHPDDRRTSSRAAGEVVAGGRPAQAHQCRSQQGHPTDRLPAN